MYDTIIGALISASIGNVPEPIEKMHVEENDETRATEKALLEKFPGLKEYPEDQLLFSVETAYRDLGFYNGFRLAVQLMAEACATPFDTRVSW